MALSSINKRIRISKNSIKYAKEQCKLGVITKEQAEKIVKKLKARLEHLQGLKMEHGGTSTVR